MKTATTNPELEAPVLPLNDRRPFLEHLEEMRRRLLRCFLWVALGMAVSWRFAPQMLEILIRPIGHVVYLSPVEPFLVHLKVALLGGLALSFPLLAREVWGFIKPAMPSGRPWPLLMIMPVSGALFLLGAWFGWALLLPAALKILLSFGAGFMSPMLTVGHYVSFAGWMIVGCGLIFQLPVAVFFLTAAGWVKPVSLVRQWRVALLGILVAAAALTPTPDVLTQLLLAGPLAGLYLFSVLLAFLVSPFSRGKKASEGCGCG